MNDSLYENASDFAHTPDGFDRLWSPHRAVYQSRGQDQVTSENDCPFCQAPSKDDEEGLIVHRGDTCFVVMNLYPYNPGHLLVCPYRHIADLPELNAAESAEFMALTQHAMKVLAGISQAQGFNLGINQGKAGGAGIAAHLHQHLIPRWSGDTNFLPLIAQTKNLSATLSQTRDALAHAWNS